MCQVWVVRLCPSTLAQRDDAEVVRVVAHELAHVATGLRTDTDDHELCEDRADHLMRLWGF